MTPAERSIAARLDRLPILPFHRRAGMAAERPHRAAAGDHRRVAGRGRCGWAFAHAGSQAMAVVLAFTMCTMIYLPELFPTALRMRGNAVTSVAGRVTAIMVPFAMVWLFNAGGVEAVLLQVVLRSPTMPERRYRSGQVLS